MFNAMWRTWMYLYIQFISEDGVTSKFGFSPSIIILINLRISLIILRHNNNIQIGTVTTKTVTVSEEQG